MSIAVQLIDKAPTTVSVETLSRLDDLFSFYHKQAWLYTKMHKRLKTAYACFNATSLLLVGLGMIVGSIWPDSFAMIWLTAASTALKGWVDFKGFAKKMEMCRFAFTTFDKIVIELQTYARGLPVDGLQCFLLEVKTKEEIITDLTPPVPDGLINKYQTLFTHNRMDIKRDV